jgi:quercetin dioxygenase-like cupin family protein
LEEHVRVIRIAEVPREPANSPLMTGGDVTRQPLVPPAEAKEFNCGIVNFPRGSRNFFHAHTSDQILVITEGIGIVATEKAGERVVSVGDVIHIPAGEKHWHGARKESYMSHITITAKGSQTTQLER